MIRLEVSINQQHFEIELDELPRAGTALQARIRPLAGRPGNGAANAETGDFESVEIILDHIARRGSDLEWYLIDRSPYEATTDTDLRWLKTARGLFQVEVTDLQVNYRRPPSGDGRIKSPIPGQVSRVFVAAGDEVHQGQALLILEAMKMQNEIRSPRAGTVKEVFVQPGEVAPLGKVMIEIV